MDICGTFLSVVFLEVRFLGAEDMHVVNFDSNEKFPIRKTAPINATIEVYIIGCACFLPFTTHDLFSLLIFLSVFLMTNYFYHLYNLYFIVR